MKLIIQIPCFNEEATLPSVVNDLPRSIPGIDQIEFLVIDDGSTDRTAEVAQSLGVNHVLRLGSNRGLARTFYLGIQQAMALGADIVVNTDGDHQYPGKEIPALVRPILENKADLVVGARPIIEHPEFSPIKKALQLLGTWTVQWISKTRVQDATSGFRALSRETCLRMFLHTRFSYTLETLIQAGNSGLRVASVPIDINRKTRPSRLFRSIPQYLFHSGVTLVGMFILYRPNVLFAISAAFFEAVALALGGRYLYLVFLTQYPDPGRTYVPSLILLAVAGLTGVIVFFLGIVAELIRTERVLTEEGLYRLRKQEVSIAHGK